MQRMGCVKSHAQSSVIIVSLVNSTQMYFIISARNGRVGLEQ